MDKDNNKQKNSAKRVPVFYIALCCCVLTVGAMGFINDRRQSERASSAAKSVYDPTPEPQLPVISSPAPLIADNGAETAEAESVSASYDEAEVSEASADKLIEDYAADNPDLAVSVTKLAEADETAAPQFIAPVSGAVLAPYSEELEYSALYGDWRSHSGVDIAAEVGASVACAADGTVTSIADTVTGAVVTVAHEGGFETVYSQLCVDYTLQEGADIKAAEVLGTVAEPQGEGVGEPHLHFEMRRDGNCIEPVYQ